MRADAGTRKMRSTRGAAAFDVLLASAFDVLLAPAFSVLLDGAAGAASVTLIVRRLSVCGTAAGSRRPRRRSPLPAQRPIRPPELPHKLPSAPTPTDAPEASRRSAAARC